MALGSLAAFILIDHWRRRGLTARFVGRGAVCSVTRALSAPEHWSPASVCVCLTGHAFYLMWVNTHKCTHVYTYRHTLSVYSGIRQNFIHSFIHVRMHTHTQTYSVSHLLAHSLINSFIHSYTQTNKQTLILILFPSQTFSFFRSGRQYHDVSHNNNSVVVAKHLLPCRRWAAEVKYWIYYKEKKTWLVVYDRFIV